MAENFTNKWDYIPTSSGNVYRMKVPGGWLIKLEYHLPNSDYMIERRADAQVECGSLVFVPDHFHDWKPTEPVRTKNYKARFVGLIVIFVILSALFSLTFKLLA